MMRPTDWRQRYVVREWFRWIPVLLLPFSALFFDTWLNTEILKRDFRMANLNAELRRLRETLDMYRVHEAQLENLDRIEFEAPDLGLVPAEPRQIQVIHYVESVDIQPELAPEPYLTAQHEDGLRRPLASAGDSTVSDEDEGNTWSLGNHSNRGPEASVMARFRQVIAAACASCFGRS